MKFNVLAPIEATFSKRIFTPLLTLQLREKYLLPLRFFIYLFIWATLSVNTEKKVLIFFLSTPNWIQRIIITCAARRSPVVLTETRKTFYLSAVNSSLWLILMFLCCCLWFSMWFLILVTWLKDFVDTEIILFTSLF